MDRINMLKCEDDLLIDKAIERFIPWANDEKARLHSSHILNAM